MFLSLHHAGLPSADWAKSKEFWCGILGMTPLAGKDNWLGWDGTTYPVHLMPSQGTGKEVSLSRHIALEVDSLEAIVAVLLDAGLKPFQWSLTNERRVVENTEQALDFGIGTVFVLDFDENAVEFIQRGRGQVKILGD